MKLLFAATVLATLVLRAHGFDEDPNDVSYLYVLSVNESLSKQQLILF
jgi:hypothetical protein